MIRPLLTPCTVALPSRRWTLSFPFAEPTTVSTIKLTADAPADYPLRWQLQGSLDGTTWTELLSVPHDHGLNPRPSSSGGRRPSGGGDGGGGGKGVGGCASHLREFRCDAPQTRSYEVRSPGDYLWCAAARMAQVLRAPRVSLLAPYA